MDVIWADLGFSDHGHSLQSGEYWKIRVLFSTNVPGYGVANHNSN